MKSNNQKGNPYHDSEGKFTSGDGGEAKFSSSGKIEQNSPRDPLMKMMKDLMNSVKGNREKASPKLVKSDRTFNSIDELWDAYDKDELSRQEFHSLHSQMLKEQVQALYENSKYGKIPDDISPDLEGVLNGEIVGYEAERIVDDLNPDMDYENEYGPTVEDKLSDMGFGPDNKGYSFDPEDVIEPNVYVSGEDLLEFLKDDIDLTPETEEFIRANGVVPSFLNPFDNEKVFNRILEDWVYSREESPEQTKSDYDFDRGFEKGMKGGED